MTEERRKNSVFSRMFDAKLAGIIFIVTATVSVISYFASPTRELADRITRLEVSTESQVQLSKQIQNLKDNDLHTLEGEMKAMRQDQEDTQNQITRLETLLEERLPK